MYQLVIPYPHMIQNSENKIKVTIIKFDLLIFTSIKLPSNTSGIYIFVIVS